MKNVLVVCSEVGRESLTELPFVLKKAGLHVTLMCSRATRRYLSSYYDRWICTSDKAKLIIPQVIDLTQSDPAGFDWIILSDDPLLHSLIDSDCNPTLKARIGPVADIRHLNVIGSKIEIARFCVENGFLTPPSRTCTSISEAEAAAETLGFPVLLKINRSGGGEGIFRCDNAGDIGRYSQKLAGKKFLVETFIDGELISVEPLFLNSKLVTYAYSKVVMFYGETGISFRRKFIPCPELQAILEDLGKKLSLTGFCNLGFIRDPKSGCHYLFEVDLRPNAWVAYARFAGIDFSQAVRGCLSDPEYRPDRFYTSAQEKIVSIFYREIPYYLRRQNFKKISYWMRNTNDCWRTIPFYDLRLLIFRMARIVIRSAQMWFANLPTKWKSYAERHKNNPLDTTPYNIVRSKAS